MRLCVYEDSLNCWLEPITLTRPAFDLWCGAQRLFERHLRQSRADEIAFWMRPSLVDVWKLDHPDAPVNDENWLRRGPTVWINGRWFAPAEIRWDDDAPHVGVVGDQIAYAVVAAGSAPTDGDVDRWLQTCRESLPQRAVGGVMLKYLWEVVDRNGETLKEDADWFLASRRTRSIPANVAVEGPAEHFVVAEGAVVEPFVFADTRGGPVLIDQGAIVHAYTRLEGPCYIGKESWIVGAKLRAGSTIGPSCRIGGEVEQSIVQGCSNKYHDGFLGHSYLGEWVNLAAATQTSDLRNDYDIVRVTVNGERLATGTNKVGSYIGDHTKTGMGALLNTGSSVGAFANILPSGSLAPQVIPSFTQVQNNELRELWDLRKLFASADKAMQRRGKALTDAHKDFYYGLFDATSPFRQKTYREGEMRKLRKSI